jgi:hypothetical protein
LAIQGIGLTSGKVNLTLKSQDGTVYNRNFTPAPPGTDLRPLITTIVTNLTDSRWAASSDGNTITIRGHYNADRTINPIKEVKSAQENVKAQNQPKFTYSDGVQVGQASSNNGPGWNLQWVGYGGGTTLDSDSTLNINIDGVDVTVGLTQGMTASDAAFATANALLAAGFGDAVSDGQGNVMFNLNLQGVTAMTVTTSWVQGSGDPYAPNGSLTLDTIIAQQSV